MFIFGFRVVRLCSLLLTFQIQWRALDEINAGVCDGMTYEEIKKNMPEEYEYVAILLFEMMKLCIFHIF